MRKVHSADSIVEIAHLRNVLQTAGIDCIVRNERLATLAGEIPFVECWPELWVCRSGDALRARGLIDLALAAADDEGPAWTCAGCGETVEPQFAVCWRCGADHNAERGATCSP